MTTRAPSVRAPQPTIAWVLSGLALCAASGAGFLGSDGGGNAVENLGGVVGLATIGGMPALGAVIVWKRPGNAIGWIFVVAGLSFGLASFTGEYAKQALVDEPASLPGGAVASWFSVWLWPPGTTLIMVFTLLLFPDGHLPSKRWRSVAALGLVAIVLQVVPMAIAAWPIRGVILTQLGDEAPASAPESFKLAFNLQVGAVLLVFVLALMAAASLVVRYRASSGEQRAQLKWFAYGGVLLVAAIILNSPLTGIEEAWLSAIGLLALPAAVAIAVLKYRLYDIDVVINKTIVVTTLAALVTIVYIAIVVGVGSLVGQRDDPDVALSILATAVVAVAFQPARQRVQQLANRLVYGARATPYEVLSAFSERMGETYASEDLLTRMARVLAEGTGAARSSVWLKIGGQLRAEATWPQDAAAPGPIPVIDNAVGRAEDVDRLVAVRHQGELLGALSIVKKPGEALSGTEETLLTDLASQAGLVLRNVGLTEQLRARLDDLQASRQRLVTAQDEERRKLERNLHDGAQQQLVALAVKERLTESLLDRDLEKARSMLQEIQTETGEALETLRDLARGIFPPLLADQGLAAALAAQARKAPLPVTVDAEGIERYPRELEAAVYFCCLEALQNIAKYAKASSAQIRLRHHDGALGFQVQDDGLGFDPATTPSGAGLQNMADRIETLGGTIEIRSAPGAGTTIIGQL